MRGRRGWSAFLGVVALVAVACSDSKEPSGSAASTTTGGAGGTAPSGPTTSARPSGPLTFRAEGVRLLNSEESDNGLRIAIDTPASEVSVVVRGLPSPNQVVMVCPAAELERRVPVPGSACQRPADGAEVKVPHAPNYTAVEIIQVGVSGSGVSGNSLTLGELTITYPSGGREVRLRLPTIPAGGVRPSFRLSPAGPGTYRATATWGASGAPTTGELAFEIGTRVVAKADGPPGVLINGNLTPVEEGVVKFRNSGLSLMLSPVVTALFP